MLLRKLGATFWCIGLTIMGGLLVAHYPFFKDSKGNPGCVYTQHTPFRAYVGTYMHKVARQVSLPARVTVEPAKKSAQKSALCIVARKKQQIRVKRALNKRIQRQGRQRKRVRARSSCVRRVRPTFSQVKMQSGSTHEKLFIWPIDRSCFWLSSPFGPRKKVDGSWGFHTGIDMAAQWRTPVKAAAAGVVEKATYSSEGYGNTVIIAHNSKFKTRYAHLDTILVTVGQKVSQGYCIGKVGATGYVRKSKNPYHLHFEVYVFGKQVNPCYFLR